ncbi:MAG: Cystathionine gamma-synthase [Candidatus Aminicenantes bacterium]|nr:Cystathionine gamma-synthase [Candidatus Aminicenantes bacterium]
MNRKEGPSTRCVHSGRAVDPVTHAMNTPIYENAAFAYDDLGTWREAALGQRPGDIYSRNSNPTLRAFNEKMAALEGAEAATDFSTGMAAINSTLFALLSPGQRAVTIKDAYGATYLHFKEILPRFGVHCELCDTDDEAAIMAAINRGCDLLYLESPTNPLIRVVDLEKLFAAAHRAGAVTVTDNTFATPINQHPLELGSDLVIHSATKFIGGHNDLLAGVVCGKADLVKKIYRYRELTGPSLDPHRAGLLLRSLKTLAIRVERHNQNALAVARFLQGHPKVVRVNYPGLESHPRHAVARKQMPGGFGGVLSFEVDGGLAAVARILPRLKYAYLAANLGQVDTVVGPPSTTSHVECTEEERRAAGIPEGLIRYSAGIEDTEDLVADLDQALAL